MKESACTHLNTNKSHQMMPSTERTTLTSRNSVLGTPATLARMTILPEIAVNVKNIV